MVVVAAIKCTTKAGQSWAKWQRPTKNYIKKFVKLTYHTCACKDLTNFEYKAERM